MGAVVENTGISGLLRGAGEGSSRGFVTANVTGGFDEAYRRV